ncbi:hypothetical protein EVB91_160 [Rhizobium phage RHph_I1_18]|nr:hypothetical protein EVB91_160 [Rhizobium phage RHph_I1_18]
MTITLTLDWNLFNETVSAIVNIFMIWLGWSAILDLIAYPGTRKQLFTWLFALTFPIVLLSTIISAHDFVTWIKGL